MNNACQIVIPARLASTRLPEKLLRTVAGKSILQHTYEAASRSRYGKDVVIAVDDPRLADEVHRFGGRSVMTSVECPSGTDRLAEVARQIPGKDIFINVQGDEPEIQPAVIDGVAERLVGDPQADLATAGVPLRDIKLLNDPSNVKIVMGQIVMGQTVPGRGGGSQFILAARWCRLSERASPRNCCCAIRRCFGTMWVCMRIGGIF